MTATSPVLTVQNLTSKGTLTSTRLLNIWWSLRYQALFHFNRCPWVTDGYCPAVKDVLLVPKDEPLPAGSWHIELLDTSDQPGALGYHDDQAFDAHSQGLRKTSERSSRGLAAKALTPLSKVFVKTATADRVPPSEVASHEMLEMLVDPRVTREADIRKYLNPRTRQWWIAEVGDPCQDEGYEVGQPEGRRTGPDSVVSNFAFPALWGQHQHAAGFDFLGRRPSAFSLSPGGYMSVAPESDPTNWSQIYGGAR